MLFKNNKKENIKVRIVEKEIGNQKSYGWRTVKPGTTIDIPEDYGKKLGLEIVEKKKETQEEVEETKKDEKFKDKLLKLEGIGDKTVEDIVNVYPTEKELKKGIKDKNLPFRDDVAKILTKKFK